MSARPLCAILATAVALAPGAAAAEDELDAGRVIAVEDRPFRMFHEFSASAGVLPLDALYTGYSLGGAYTLHLSDLVAWEAISFHYSANVTSDLEKRLAERWSVAATKQPRVEYVATSNLVLSPLFGKTSAFNGDITWLQTSLTLGGGIAHFTDGFRPAVSGGLLFRVFFSQRVSARLDLRSTLVPDLPSGIEHVLQVMLGVSFNFGTIFSEDDDGANPDTSTGFEALDELYPSSDPDAKKSGEEKTSR
ncbi:outer membrane beta-barrel domain-containing protein [Myxococcota bacterium]|nr:outer membrane beta-barrel domain-containing protein [Myxococcota bacterium]